MLMPLPIHDPNETSAWSIWSICIRYIEPEYTDSHSLYFSITQIDCCVLLFPGRWDTKTGVNFFCWANYSIFQVINFSFGNRKMKTLSLLDRSAIKTENLLKLSSCTK